MKKSIYSTVIALIALPLLAANVEMKYSGPSSQGSVIWWSPANNSTQMVMTTNGITVFRVPGGSGIVYTNASLTLTKQPNASVTSTVVTLTQQANPSVTSVVATVGYQGNPALTNLTITKVTNTWVYLDGTSAIVTNSIVYVSAVANQAAANAAVTSTVLTVTASANSALTNAALTVGTAANVAVTNVVLSNP